ncbi:FAD dependent oxidoreductase [Mrakia frigida]|uniref:NAD(P)/FAD-dependent oxidoreductase n=1 Tax=Mrakia frigida TaxID=29902 RepID=UPI003FCC217A
MAAPFSSSVLRARFPLLPPTLEVDHLVVGGGVIGLAIAERLVKRFPNRSTYLVEKHDAVGQETSSRNSEVIHAGLYYPPDSLKTRFCIRGRKLLYERCERMSIPFRKTGKLILATQSKQQILYVGRLFMHTQHHLVNVPSWLLTGPEAREMEPKISEDISTAVYSPETGIVDSHALMRSLEKEIGESEAGEIVLGTRVVRIDQQPSSSPTNPGGWLVQTLTSGEEKPDCILAKSLILTAGLTSAPLLNPLLPPLDPEIISPTYAKGTYFSYKGPGVAGIQKLLYPCPEEGMVGLGTHMTMDLEGKVKFGPDVEWIGEAGEAERDPEFWTKHLGPSEGRLEEMAEAVREYLPDVRASGFAPDYAGIRPNISPPNAPNPDFKIIHSHPSLPNLVALVGMGSPGLTSALAIGEGMERFFSKVIWKEGEDGLEAPEEDDPRDGREWWEIKRPWWRVW